MSQQAVILTNDDHNLRNYEVFLDHKELITTLQTITAGKLVYSSLQCS